MGHGTFCGAVFISMWKMNNFNENKDIKKYFNLDQLLVHNVSTRNVKFLKFKFCFRYIVFNANTISPFLKTPKFVTLSVQGKMRMVTRLSVSR